MTVPDRPGHGAGLTLPAVPVVVAGAGAVTLLTPDGEIHTLSPGQAKSRLAEMPPPMLCHAPSVGRRIGAGTLRAYDLLELYAFVRPARFCVPTPRGLATALELEIPDDPVDQASSLLAAAARLLDELAGCAPDARLQAAGTAASMARHGWPWAQWVLLALGEDPAPGGLDVWRRLTDWNEAPPPTPPGHQPVTTAEARRRLADLLGADAEPRPEQADYASACTFAFAPIDREGEPCVVLSEAGTGVGKTLGYIAPASVWAEKNEGTVWLSTYTKNLQRQIDRELDRLHPDPRRKARKVVVRKGRENYLCLLNMEEAARAAETGVAGPDGIALGLMARWAGATRDGDMVGGDFPAWLGDLLGRRRTLDLTDRRGECVYSACPHYRKCFIERAVRRARQAEMVIANHALVMIQAALGEEDGRYLPTRYVFDEGHHLFDAADGAFSAHLSGFEGAELRRWLRGVEDGGRSRARGLRRRIEDLVTEPAMQEALEAIHAAAGVLPGSGWAQRIRERQPRGGGEHFLALVHQQVTARAGQSAGAYGTETEARPPVDGLLEAASALESGLANLAEPMRTLETALLGRLDDEADTLETATRLRIEAACRGLRRRRVHMIDAWRDMLKGLDGAETEGTVDWMSIERYDGREIDVGMHRHWIDPTLPFARIVLARAYGAVITSATLRDTTGNAEADWTAAEARTGAVHLPVPAVRASLSSPFDYAAQTRAFVVTDVRRDQPDEVAAAYRALFSAAGGGGLGLFTAISRLRAVHQRIAQSLDEEGIALLAQHVDPLDPSTLIEIFRAERDSCLLGTDAMRDGVDVPGDGLRLIVFDRVPWPRPDILHKARRNLFGGRGYDDRIARFRLRQAFGRLVRRSSDAGVFVLLDAMTPSRLLTAFPEGVSVRRVGLAEAIAETKGFLSEGHRPELTMAPLST